MEISNNASAHLRAKPLLPDNSPEARNRAAGMVTITSFPQFYAGLLVWKIRKDGTMAAYRHPTKKATMGRCRVLRMGEVVAIRDYNRRKGGR